MFHSTRLRNQRGAALIVGMVLLLVLTLLAVAGMNTASLEFAMAGNHQYRSRAIEAADAGVETGYARGTLNPQATYNEVFAGVMPGSTDSFRANVTWISDAPAAVPIPGYSGKQFGAFFFRVQSVGTSARNSTATHTQEMWTLGPDPGGTPNPIGNNQPLQ